jgi:hypothetical protein
MSEKYTVNCLIRKELQYKNRVFQVFPREMLIRDDKLIKLNPVPGSFRQVGRLLYGTLSFGGVPGETLRGKIVLVKMGKILYSHSVHSAKVQGHEGVRVIGENLPPFAV